MDYNQSHKTLTDEIPSVAHNNIMFASNGKAWGNATDCWKAGYGGWSWNAKFADLDNDGWQDLFIVQGTRLRLYNPSNVFYRNKGGERLEEVTRPAGLEDHLPTAASLFLDYDEDGDLDLVTFPFQLNPVLWRNDNPAGPGFEVRLDDWRTANRYGVGARVEIRSSDGRLQIRDVKASGGHQSHDVLVARFGLGDWKSVASVRVTWPDGETSQVAQGPMICGSLPVGAPRSIGSEARGGVGGGARSASWSPRRSWWAPRSWPSAWRGLRSSAGAPGTSSNGRGVCSPVDRGTRPVRR